MAEISNLLSHFSAMCHNICVKPDEGYNLSGLLRALYAEAITLYFQRGYYRRLALSRELRIVPA